MSEEQEVTKTSPFLDQLPIGLINDEGWKRDYVLRELSAADSRRIRDDQLIRTRPVEWMSHVLSLSLESLFGESIYEPYKASTFKIYPKIVKKLAMQDVTYLLAAAHVHTFGSTLDGMRVTCPTCRTQTTLSVDLNELDITRASSPVEDVIVKLNKGFRYSGEMDYLRDRVYIEYHLRPPTLDDFIAFQDKFVRSTNGPDVNTAVLRRCITQITDDRGEDMPKESIQTLGTRLLEELSGSDYNKVVASFNGLPGLDRKIEYVCSNPACRVQSLTNVDYSFFFPRG